FVSQEQLKKEIASEISKLGRVSVIDLADTIGVDFISCAQDVVLSDPELMLVQGEIISQRYWDSIAEEINERLQECSQISVAELAGQLQVGIRVAAVGFRASAWNFGVSLFLPICLSLWTPLVQEMNGASVENSFFQSIFDRLLKEEEMLGSLRAGTHWTPSVFAVAQKECVDSFFSQVCPFNSYIPYGISLKPFSSYRYPDGKPLAAVFIHSSMIEMLDSTTEDAIEQNSWIDSLSVLPASFTSQDANKMLLLRPISSQVFQAEKALILGESYVLSNGFIKGIYDQIEKEAEAFSIQASNASLIDHSSKSSESVESIPASANTDKGSKKKKGKSVSMKTATDETVSDDEEDARPKSKRNQKKGRGSS
ncbi:E3 UFM1-protein ligase 1, partial [Arabidopsis suecica]